MKKEIIAFIFIEFIIFINVSIVADNIAIVLINSNQDYSYHLPDMGIGGEFKITMLFESSDNNSITFHYSVNPYIKLISNNSNINYYNNLTQNHIEGVLISGQNFIITHQLKECAGDDYHTISFMFSKNFSTQVNLQMQIDILKKGNLNCGTRLGDPRLIYLYALLEIGLAIIVAIPIIYYTKKKVSNRK